MAEDLQSYGSTTVKTPHMDQLADEGIRFTDCYVTAPVCAPSRASLLTGRYNERYGFETQPMEIYPNNLPSYWIGKYMINMRIRGYIMPWSLLTECQLPDDRVYDGTDLMPYLAGKNAGMPHENFYWKADHIQAMRKSEWKYLQSIRDGWIELYNIKEDKYEKIDLLNVRPDILIQLQEQFDIWEKDLMPPLWPRIMDYRIVIDGKEYLFPA